MSKDAKNALLIIGIIILLTNPILLFLGVIGFIIYLSYKDKNKLKSTTSKVKEKYKNSNKTSNYEVIDTTGEVIDTVILQQDEWKATKEYKR